VDVSGALPKAIILEFRDEEWIQNIEYEQILFRCKRCHEHGNLIKESLIIKKKKRKTPNYNRMKRGL
jgi:hypothetical protein